MYIFLGIAVVLFALMVFKIRKDHIAEEEAEAFRSRARKQFLLTSPPKTMSAAGRIGLRVMPPPKPNINDNFQTTTRSTPDNFGVRYHDMLTQTVVTSTLLDEMDDRNRTTAPVHHEVHHTAAPSTDYGSGVCHDTSNSHNSHDTSSSSSYDSGSSYDSCSYDSGSSSFSSD